MESKFYSVASNILKSNGAAIPKLVKTELPKDTLGNVHTLVMTDLRPEYPEHPESLTVPTAQAAARWLATLHAAFWSPAKTLPGLWEKATFWDLEKDGEETIHKIGPNWSQTSKNLCPEYRHA